VQTALARTREISVFVLRPRETARGLRLAARAAFFCAVVRAFPYPRLEPIPIPQPSIQKTLIDICWHCPVSAAGLNVTHGV
jgi:hypothetical protein